jgi:hypothetical protein
MFDVYITGDTAPCHPWCIHRTSLVVQKVFSVFLWPWTIPLSWSLGFLVINVCNHGEHYETPYISSVLFYFKNLLCLCVSLSLIINACLKRCWAKCRKLQQLSVSCRSMEHRMKPVHDRWICRRCVLTTLLCIQKCTPEFTRKCLLIETEHHRKQPVHTRLLHWLPNKRGNQSPIPCQKRRTKKDITRNTCVVIKTVSRYVGSKYARTFTADLRAAHLIAQSCLQVSAVSQDHKWYRISYRLGSIAIYARTLLLNTANFSSCEVPTIYHEH